MTAVGTPVTRVDGPAKVTGAARYSAEIALPGTGLPRDRRRDDRQRPRRSRSTPTAARAADGVLAVLTHENLPKIAARAAPAAVAGRRRGARRELLPDAGRRGALRRAAGGPRRRRAATSRRSTPRRWCGSRTTTTAVGHDDRPGPRPGLRGGAALRRADARPQRARRRRRPALRSADVRVEVAYRMAANHHNPLEAPSTVAVWDGGRLTLHDSTQGIRATQQTVAAAARAADRPRPGRHAVRRRRVRLQGDGLAARDTHRDGRPARRPAGQAHAHPAADVHVERPPRGAGAAHHARRRRATGG